MKTTPIDAPGAPQPRGGYSQAVQIDGAQRWLMISGQVPEDAEGNLPAGFTNQCRMAWRNVEAQLHAAGMTLDNLVKVTTFLADRRHGIENRQVRQEVLGDRRPALTVIIAGIFEERWLVEIEAVAVA